MNLRFFHFRGVRQFCTRLASFAQATTLAVLILFAGSGCERNGETAAKKRTVRPNVILIILDTTRADRFGCYGNDLGLTPGIDKLAATGVRFENAFAHAPWTLPSTASLLTSRLPSSHGAGGRVQSFTPLADSVATLAGQFKSAGYKTAAIINVFFLTERFGLTRGFDHVDYFEDTTNEHMRPAAETTDAAIQWLSTSSTGPVFAMVHYFDPHLIYAPPAEFREQFADPRDRNQGQPLFGNRRDMVKLRTGEIKTSDLPIDRLEKLYNGEIAYTDQQVTRLIDWLKSSGMYDDTIVVITSDHGEEFLEHGGYEHGHTLYNELLHVPLIIAGCDVPSGVNANDVVGLMDVAPTLLRLAGIDSCNSFHGQDLTPAFDRAPLLDRAVFSEGNMWDESWYALHHDNHKLITIPAGDKSLAMLFDLAVDPGEKTDIATRHESTAKRLLADMVLILRAASTTRSKPVDFTDTEWERLRALGYVGEQE